jgi:hypothetical protein
MSKGVLSRRTKRTGPKRPSEEIGATGLKQSGGRIYEEFHPKLSGKRAAKVYREMRDNCAVIGAPFFAAELYLADNGFRVVPSEDTQLGNELADFVDGALDDMEHTRSDFLAEVISMAWQGYSIHEKVYKRRRGDNIIPELQSKYNDGLVGIRKLPIRSQDTIEEWVFGEHGDVHGAIQQAPPDYKVVELFRDEFAHFRTTSSKNNPLGRSWLRNAYRSWWFLKRIQEYEAIGVSKDMAGVPVGRAPKEFFRSSSNLTDDQRSTVAQCQKVLGRMQRGEQEFLWWPSAEDSNGKTGWDAYLMQSGGRRPMDVDGIVRRYESRILVSMLAEAVLLGQQGNVGSWSLASTQTHMFAVALGGLQRKIAETVNREILPELVALNGWPSQAAPIIEFADLESEDIVQKLTAVAQAVGAGVIVPDEPMDDYFRERLDLPHRYEQEQISRQQLDDAVGAAIERDNNESQSDTDIQQQ